MEEKKEKIKRKRAEGKGKRKRERTEGKRKGKPVFSVLLWKTQRHGPSLAELCFAFAPCDPSAFTAGIPAASFACSQPGALGHVEGWPQGNEGPRAGAATCPGRPG